MEGLIFGVGLSTEENLRFKIDWASLIAGSKFTVVALFYFVFEGNFPSTSPRGAYIWRGDLTEGFLALPVWGGLIFGGAYTWRGLFSEFYGNLHMNACAQGFALIKRFGVTQKSATSHVKIQTCPVIQGNTVYFNK